MWGKLFLFVFMSHTYIFSISCTNSMCSKQQKIIPYHHLAFSIVLNSSEKIKTSREKREKNQINLEKEAKHPKNNVSFLSLSLLRISETMEKLKHEKYDFFLLRPKIMNFMLFDLNFSLLFFNFSKGILCLNIVICHFSRSYANFYSYK